ncbi:hypothetical protein B0T25DRAFT_535218 [Lasiosphaeria hispida]|uniref:Uncharacterized protein n=1 Tax=Lasiosphaeria hispida TaxID=260671 RepID=A0AAJ0HRW8_9PEZI|nr:hypothetical protein B0T25DRAFT_535218 [Lasiosphaeria hispida]
MDWMEEKKEFERRQLEDAQKIKALKQKLREAEDHLGNYVDHLHGAEHDLRKTRKDLYRAEADLNYCRITSNDLLHEYLRNHRAQTEQVRATSEKFRETEITMARYRGVIRRLVDHNNKLRRQLAQPVFPAEFNSPMPQTLSQPSLSLASVVTVVSVEPSDSAVVEAPPCATRGLQLSPQTKLEFGGSQSEFRQPDLVCEDFNPQHRYENSESEFDDAEPEARCPIRSEFVQYPGENEQESEDSKPEVRCGMREEFKQHPRASEQENADLESGGELLGQRQEIKHHGDSELEEEELELEDADFEPKDEGFEPKDEDVDADDEYFEPKDKEFEQEDEDFESQDEDVSLNAWDVLTPTGSRGSWLGD